MSARTGARPGVLLPFAGALAVLASSTAMAEMIAGSGWFAALLGGVLIVVGLGTLIRNLVRPARSGFGVPLVVLCQLLALLCYSVVLYSQHGVLGFLPGSDAIHELGAQLGQALEEIRTGRPPVPATPAMRCLIVLAVGLVAVLVDLLVVDVRMPAVSGLLLLGVYAVPSSIADALLPWWSFALGALAFALLLAIDRARRDREWRGSPGTARSGPRISTPMVAVTAIAVACALLAGGTVTVIGTSGTLPGQQAGRRTVNGTWGLNPFTKLRGELDSPDKAVDLFRIKGEEADQGYLRAVTLSRFDPKTGWRVGPINAGQPLRGELQDPPGSQRQPGTSRIKIEPVNWQDHWLPLFGVPGQVSGLDPRTWHWDPNLSSAYARTPTKPGEYTEQANLRQPSAEALRAAPPGTRGLPNAEEYTALPKIDPRVRRLGERLTKGKDNTFDKVRALWAYFTKPGNFTYSLSTKPQALPDPLADFLLRSKQGFCEQFASAMAVLARDQGIPARVAVGFTPGTSDGAERTVTTQDAHAWVEIYFPGQGWMTFDPTPLTDGRGITPSYLQRAEDTKAQDRKGGPAPSSELPSVSPAPPNQQPERSAAAPPAVPPRDDDWWPPLAQGFTLSAPGPALWLLLGLLLAAGGLTAAAVRAGGFRGPRAPRNRSNRGGGRHAR